MFFHISHCKCFLKDYYHGPLIFQRVPKDNGHANVLLKVLHNICRNTKKNPVEVKLFLEKSIFPPFSIKCFITEKNVVQCM